MILIANNKVQSLQNLMIILAGIMLFPAGCIIPYEPYGVQDTEGILAVDGMILETGATIKLSRTVSLYNTSEKEPHSGMEDVYHALVQVIDDQNNVVGVAEQLFIDGKPSAEYIVNDEISFIPGTKYALYIEVGGKKYQSSFVSPVMTPEIDEITWKQNDDLSMDIMVSTHDPGNIIEYYCWSFAEDWEYWAQEYGTHRYDPATGKIIEQNLFTANNRYYCWGSNKSRWIIVGASDKLTEATIKNRIIHSFPSNNTRFSYLYSILVKQYALDKEAYAYYDNLKKNIELSGSLFGPILSEIRGNITCLSNPDEPVIGYVFATKEVTARMYIDMEKIKGEDRYDCYHGMQGQSMAAAFYASNIINAYHLGLDIHYGVGSTYYCIQKICLDCTMRGGTKNKPDFWPNDHL